MWFGRAEVVAALRLRPDRRQSEVPQVTSPDLLHAALGDQVVDERLDGRQRDPRCGEPLTHRLALIAEGGRSHGAGDGDTDVGDALRRSGHRSDDLDYREVEHV